MRNKAQKIASELKFYFVPRQENHYEPQILKGRFLFACVMILIALKLLILPIFYFLDKSAFYAAVHREMLVALVNEERSKNNLPPLKENKTLDKVAELKADNMLAEGYFSHSSPSGTSPWHWFNEAGYNYRVAGENLAIGFVESGEVFEGWKNSPSHLANLLNPKFEEVGIAVLRGDFRGKETTIVVQALGAPKVQQSQPSVNNGQPTPAPQKQNVSIPSKPVSVARPSPTPLLATSEPVAPSATPLPTAKPIVTSEPVLAPSPSIALQPVAQISPKSEPLQKEKPAEIIYSKEVAGEKVEEHTLFGFWKFMVDNYYDLIQKIIFYTLLFIVVALLLNIFIKINIQRPTLIFKTVFFIALLVGFSLLSKDSLLQIIPHNLMIF